MSEPTPSDTPTPTGPYCNQTRNDGQPCRGYATRTGKCAGHSRLGATANPQANAAKSAQIRTEKATNRKKTLLDLIAERLEQRAETIVKTYETAGADGDWRALEALITRVHGKPVERVEHLETDAGNVAALSREQRQVLRRQLVSENPELLELVPRAEVG